MSLAKFLLFCTFGMPNICQGLSFDGRHIMLQGCLCSRLSVLSHINAGCSLSAHLTQHRLWLQLVGGVGPCNIDLIYSFDIAVGCDV